MVPKKVSVKSSFMKLTNVFSQNSFWKPIQSPTTFKSLDVPNSKTKLFSAVTGQFWVDGYGITDDSDNSDVDSHKTSARITQAT